MFKSSNFMKQERKFENIKQWSDSELIDLLFTEADQLPRTVVDELVRRGEPIIQSLWFILRNDHFWHCDSKRQWAVIHATFILGAIGSKATIAPLLTSVRRSNQYDCDWLWEVFPTIFRSIGPVALTQLKAMALDQSNDWWVRTTALEAMAAITIDHPNNSREIFDFITSFLRDHYEDHEVRGSVAGILLDFASQTYEKSLLEFAEEETYTATLDPLFQIHIDSGDVRRAIKEERKIPDHYQRNWLQFYDSDEIQARQKRWREEKTWWMFPVRWWRLYQDRSDFRKRIAEFEKVEKQHES